MNLLELTEEFRRQVSDEAQPPLWSDDEVLLYIIDAQDLLVRKLGGIADVTVAAADIGSPQDRLQDLDVVTDEPYTVLDPYILRIRSARLLTAARDVVIVQEADLAQILYNDYGWRSGLQLDDSDSGQVTHGVLGIKDDNVRWLRVPAEDDTCRLNVFRLPYPRITALDGDIQLEIHEQHHRHLILWMKHLAYSKQDAETRNDKLAAESAAAFEAYADKFRKEVERRRYRPRQVKYAGLV